MPPAYQRVFFLGAGASAPFGVPITGAILPLIVAHLNDGTLFGLRKETRRRHARMRNELRDGLEKVFPSVLAGAASPLVTDLFSLLDHMVTTQQAPTRQASVGEIARLRKLLEQATLWVLAHPARAGTKQFRSEAHDFYARLVNESRRSARRTCFITTNYDREVEAAVLPAVGDRTETAIDFGVPWRHYSRGDLVGRPTAPTIGIFKLHGSTTWLACPRCGHVYIRPDMSVWSVGYWDTRRRFNTCHCNYAPLQPVVVAPSLVRTLAESCLTSTWKAALEGLQSASEWIFVGYSFPNEDIAIRALLMRAYYDRPRGRPAVHVVLRERDEAIEGRYRFLFSNCSFDRCGFEAFIRSTVPS